ncbi:MAG: hypothetical protein MK008_12315 [Bdellovibrionales bacterium]|nr:hypothetical protein [Bdellovibrionales bacterium]
MRSKKSFKILYFIIPLSFVLGLAWGINFKKNQLNTQIIKPSKPKITIAAPKGLINDSLLKQFTQETGIVVDMIANVGDADYSQAVIKHQKHLDTALVPRHMITTLEKLKLTKPHQYKNLRDKISADFLNLNYDPKNKKYIPFAWNFYEVAYDPKSISKDQLTLQHIIDNKISKKLVDFNFIETYFILKKTELISDEWIKTQREDLIEAALNRLLKSADFKNMPASEDSSKSYNWIYTSHVKAQKTLELNPEWKSEIAEEKSNINILLWATFKRNQNINQFLDFVKTNHESIIEPSEYASVFKNSKLPEYQQSKYIRSRSLLKLEMVDAPHIMEGIWSQSYKKVMPINTQTNASNVANY